MRHARIFDAVWWTHRGYLGVTTCFVFNVCRKGVTFLAVSALNRDKTHKMYWEYKIKLCVLCH